jgi:hypothetical protein
MAGLASGRRHDEEVTFRRPLDSQVGILLTEHEKLFVRHVLNEAAEMQNQWLNLRCGDLGAHGLGMILHMCGNG